MKAKKSIVILMIGILSMVMVSFTGCSKGSLVVGTNAAFPPFEYIEEGEVVGFDMELAQLIADELGMKLVIEDMEFATLLAAVNTGKVDFVAAGMTATDERAEQVDFSKTYFKSKQTIIVNEGDDSIRDPEDLVGKKVGVQLGTTGDLFATDTEGIEVVRFDKAALAVGDLKNNKIDAVIVDEQPAIKIADNQTGVTLLDAPFIDEEYAIAVKKGNKELLEKINKVLDDIKADGTYDALYEKYFGKTE